MIMWEDFSFSSKRLREIEMRGIALLKEACWQIYLENIIISQHIFIQLTINPEFPLSEDPYI